MKYLYALLSLVLVFIWGTSSSSAWAQNLPKTEPFTVIYKLKPAASSHLNRAAAPSAVQQVVQRVAAGRTEQKFPRAANSVSRTSKKNAVDLSLIYQMRYNSDQTFVQVKKQLLETGLVEYVEPLYQYEPLHVPNDPKADSVSGSQKYLKKIGAFQAWDVTKGDTTVVIGILDTGVRLTHEDLKNKINYNYADPIDGIDNDGDGFKDNFRGWDMADGDNDPTADANGHGTFVTGIAAAQANNGVGMAGVGYNAKFLPIKVFASTPTGSFKGYEALVYAADQGCKVINLSWGGASFASAFEQDVINYAVLDKDVVIVAAAGNTNAELDFYPASYQNVISVAALDQNDIKGGSHTYSYNIDLGALGIGVFSTGNANDTNYGNGTGSSYASPMVAGAAALLRSHFPDLSALQIGERLRVTADDIYSLAGNASFKEKLGTGRLNVYKALTAETPFSVRLTSWDLLSSSELGPGGEVSLVGKFVNYLSPISGLTVSLTSSSPYLQVLQGDFSAGSLGTMENTQNTETPFKLKVALNTPANTPVTLRIGFTNGASYTDYQYITLVLNQNFLTTDVNNLAVSVMSTGNIGYNGLNYSQGKGVVYRGSASLLAEGGLLIGYSPTLVSDNIRNEKGSTDRDFYAVTNLQRKRNAPYAEFYGSNVMQDSLTTTKNKSLNIQQNVFAWSTSPNRDFVVLQYILTNRTQDTIANAHAGMFADWDIISAARNVAEWDNSSHMGIIRHKSDTSLWAGIQLLTKGAPSFYALDNTTGTGPINMSDGFSTKEKYQALSGGIQRDSAGFTDGKDVYYIISSAIRTLAPGQTDTVAFAIVVGQSRAEMKKSASAALLKYNQIQGGGTVTAIPSPVDVKAVALYPNPSRGRVTVTLPPALQQTTVIVQLVDSKGQVQPQGSFQRKDKIYFDFSNLTSGMYYLRLVSNAGTVTQKLMIAK
ncbi:S8/S53 family peptidase [Rufibacter latericius]|uniref:T9SS C-terminal target domain-containing protein n=1 Tax=Rufibacter latericius TaxID=2487040 RepID=A0A3M9MUR6_9BACT|nr:S8/S53 family peptidase [Rufibacter latericius]RNI29250.1 T9SS C-terminal target domain-containing protein [Rufibacter latericius]